MDTEDADLIANLRHCFDTLGIKTQEDLLEVKEFWRARYKEISQSPHLSRNELNELLIQLESAYKYLKDFDRNELIEIANQSEDLLQSPQPQEPFWFEVSGGGLRISIYRTDWAYFCHLEGALARLNNDHTPVFRLFVKALSHLKHRSKKGTWADSKQKGFVLKSTTTSLGGKFEPLSPIFWNLLYCHVRKAGLFVQYCWNTS